MKTADGPEFTLPELAAYSDLEYRTLHMWLQRGLIRASLVSATGSGTANLFDEADLLETKILADLRRFGAEMSVLHQVADALRQQSTRLGDNETLIINGRVEIVREHEAAERITSCSPSFVYSIAHAKEALAARFSVAA